MKLEKDDLDAITAAVIEGIKAAGIGAAAAPKTGDKPAGKGTANKPADKPAETKTEPTEDEVKKARAALLEKLKATGEKIGKDNAKAIVGNYADGFANVKFDDFAKLEADLEKAANEAADSGDSEY